LTLENVFFSKNYLKECIFLETELYHANLWEYLANDQKEYVDPPIGERVAMGKEVTEGVIYLQSKDIKHLDLKLSNILLKLKSASKNRRQVI
jgi:serine/threonine protein kinase